jgi:hypothetical protein
LRAAGEPPTLEYPVKAGCLFRFAQFVTWPDSTFTNANAPLVVAVLAPEAWHQSLREAFAGKKINDRPVELRILTEASLPTPCHVLFVTSPEHRRFSDLLAERRTGTLTVGETERFLAAGGMITFVLVESKVRFDVDLEAARHARLTLDPRMLAQARNVYTARKPPPPR